MLAAFIRFWAAPFSTGPDVPQFWAFAKVFHDHGLDFYRFADASLPIFPYQGWGFLYPPVWLLILGLALIFVPPSLSSGHLIDSRWRIAEKFPIIAADLAISLLIFWAVPGSKWRKLLFACLWLFHPTAWYESAVFGQFDAIAATFLLASVIMLIRNKDRIAFLLAGLAVMTKQHTLIPVALMLVVCAKQMTKCRLLTNCSILVGVVVLFSIPFLITGNFYSYARSIVFPLSVPGYQDPLVFAFSGIGALVTQLHNSFGWEISGLLKFCTPLLVIALIITGILAFKKAITPLQAALIGFLLFISLFYRVNYQYLVIYIPLAILQASRTTYRSERIFALALAFLPATWLWFNNMPFWFNDWDPHFPWVNPILARFGLAERILPDYIYATLAVAIMCFSLMYIVLTFVRWQQPKDQSNPPSHCKCS